jgi:phosphatidylglycerophosphate synthase
VSRSTPTIDRRPGVSRLRASAIAVDTAGLAFVAALAWSARDAFELSSGYPWRAAAAFSVVALATMGGLGAHPFSHFGIANAVTTVRAALVALVLAATVEPAAGNASLGAAMTALAVVALDGVDGWAARRSGMASEFGARYDMEVDALLVLALSVLAWRTGRAEAWIVSAGAMRYAFVAGGWVWGWLKRPLPPRWRRQAVCVVQVVAMSAALLPGLPPELAFMLLGGALLLLVYSFAVDIAWLWKRRSALGGVAIA